MTNVLPVRTFLYKEGDTKADSMIKEIINEGWQMYCVTPAGSVRIASFEKTELKQKSVVNV